MNNVVSAVKYQLTDSELLGFQTLPIIWYSKNWRTQHFTKWIWFHPQVRGKTPRILRPLQRANLNHWITLVRFTKAI
jgi:hypothetical protein